MNISEKGDVMNIVYVSDQYWPSVSGVPVSMDSFKDQFTEQGHNISLLVPEYPEADTWDREHNAQNLFRFKSRQLILNKENRLVCRSEKNKVFARLDAIKPDIIHIHTEFSLAKMAIKYAKKNNIPLVLTAHTNWEELVNEYAKFIPNFLIKFYCRSFLRRTFNKVDRIIVPTTLMESRLNLYSINRPIDVIPTGIDVSHFTKAVAEIENSQNSIFLNLAEKIKDHKMLLYVGRLGKEKNIKFLINVFYTLAAVNEDIKLVIVGDGPARIELEEYARSLGLIGRVIFTGYVDREQLMNFYTMAHIFMFASKIESQGLVILESMTCGTPVVAIGEMGTRALMGSGNGGFMVDDDLDLFVEKVALLLYDKELHKIKSAEALKEAKKWESNMMSTRVFELYENLLYTKRIMNDVLI